MPPEREGIDWAAMHARIKVAMDGLARGFEPGADEVRRRLHERAERLARAAEAPAADEDEIRILEFRIGGRPHAVDSRLVREVCAPVAPTRVPQAPAWAAGVVHLRGEILTVLDFAALLGQGDGAAADGPLMVLQEGNRSIGLPVDEIHGLRDVTRASLDPVPAAGQGGRRFALGVTGDGTLVLDAVAFFEDGALTGTADGSAGTRGNAR